MTRGEFYRKLKRAGYPMDRFIYAEQAARESALDANQELIDAGEMDAGTAFYMGRDVIYDTIMGERADSGIWLYA